MQKLCDDLETSHPNSRTAAASSIAILQGSMQNVENSTVQESLKCQADKIAQNDFSDLESMLSHQAYMLDRIFSHSLEKVASASMWEDARIYSGMAFKAQNLFRMTVETLANIKRPASRTIIKNEGNQQINIHSDGDDTSK